MVLSTERRAVLYGTQLSALVRDHFDVTAGEPEGFPTAAAVASGPTGWFLAADHGCRSLGPALAWARANGVDELHVLVADPDPLGPGTVARRATLFDGRIDVWRADGRDLRRAEPATHLVESEPPQGVDRFVDLLHEAGVHVVTEHGVIAGEIEGLEIARVVDDRPSPSLEVGIGVNDRDAFKQMYGEVPTAEALSTVIESVRQHRRVGSPQHPLSRMAQERWRRDRLCDEPGRVAMTDLVPVSALFPPNSVHESVPAAAIGTAVDGAATMVVTSAGIDLDLVPTAADLRSREEIRRPGAGPLDLVLVVPPRDAHPVTVALAGRLRSPARVVALDPLED